MYTRNFLMYHYFRVGCYFSTLTCELLCIYIYTIIWECTIIVNNDQGDYSQVTDQSSKFQLNHSSSYPLTPETCIDWSVYCP